MPSKFLGELRITRGISDSRSQSTSTDDLQNHMDRLTEVGRGDAQGLGAIVRNTRRRFKSIWQHISNAYKRAHTSQSSTSPTRYSVDGSRFWAVLIGIDAYQENPLRGCVSDALSMKDFLTKELGVPEGRIQCLLGPNNPTPGNPNSTPTPSRANIVDTLYSLVHNPEIVRDDNIVIYYAGHGSTYRCPEHPRTVQCRSGLSPIEALCPLDRDTQDADAKWIPDISDREINNLFKRISLAKGNKITFITDCCYGGSSSRDSQVLGERFMRATKNASLHDMLHAADERWKHSGDPSKYQSVLSKDWRPYMGSHVVLGACKRYETAKEEQAHNGFCGVFTRALVSALRSTDWKKETTYVALIKLLNRSLSDQTPLVAGKLKGKRLFYQAAMGWIL